MSKKTKHKQQTPIDLVADFYSQEKLDLDQIVRVKKASIQSVVNYSLAPYSGNFGFDQKKHLVWLLLMKKTQYFCPTLSNTVV